MADASAIAARILRTGVRESARILRTGVTESALSPVCDAGTGEGGSARASGGRYRRAAMSGARLDDEDGPDGDELPEELDVTLVGPYTFPDIRRRRIAGSIHAVLAAGCAWVGVASENSGFMLAAVLLALSALYHFSAAWPLRIDQTEALATASRTVGFPVGHSSAQLAWRGLRSRPTWRILVFSADEPPSIRGLVELDAVDGTVLGEYTEANPEDWSQYTNA